MIRTKKIKCCENMKLLSLSVLKKQSHGFTLYFDKKALRLESDRQNAML